MPRNYMGPILLLIGLFCPFLLSAHAATIDDIMPQITQSRGTPMTMINLSRDHQLSYKAYNDYTDLDGDALPEKTYLHAHTYYGYFDPQRCYVYDTAVNQFNSSGKSDSANYCNGRWSGNFLNWATMTRMDVVRKILYGGYRKIDTAAETVLERAFLPTDAHAFAKFYDGADIAKLTPFSNPITLCNATIPSSATNANRFSHTNTDPPLIRVAGGDYSLWNSNERWQCYWKEEKNAVNGNTVAVSGLAASGSNPSKAVAQGVGKAPGDYVVRVRVCADSDVNMTTDELSRCRQYATGKRKPIGLLHTYGENDQTEFGMITGSFSKNISGGVLRRNVTSFATEVNLQTDGTFVSTVKGIVYNLNRLRVYGYDYSDGTYLNSDTCTFQRIGIGTGGSYAVPEGNCSSWGNPIGTMFLEALRYFGGAGAATPAYVPGSGSKDDKLGLTIEAFKDPLKQGNEAKYGDAVCRPMNIINFNASVNSYDSDSSKWTGFGSLYGSPSIDAWTDKIGGFEGLAGKKWFVGNNGAVNNNLCTDKEVTRLSAVKGVCPEAPTYYGSYKLAGAAFFAHTNPIRNDFVVSPGVKAFRVNTYSVALATGAPKIELNVNGKKVVIQPSYRLDLGGGNVGAGTLVDFRIVTQTATYGKYVVQWEDSEQGGDYDQDVWGTMEYQVTGNQVKVTTSVVGYASANGQGLGYVISGTDRDGPHYHSGAYNFTYNDPNPNTIPGNIGGTRVNASGGCQGCNGTEGKSFAIYNISGTGVAGESLKDPLFYAAKYGNFAGDYKNTALTADQWDIKKTDGTGGADGIPDAYFYAIDPAQLERSIRAIFDNLIPSGGTSPAVTGSRLQANGRIFLTQYRSNDADPLQYAIGNVLGYVLKPTGEIDYVSAWDASNLLTARSAGSRSIITNNLGVGAPFQWSTSNLSPAQMLALNSDYANFVDSKGALRLAYLRGDRTNEIANGFRKRGSLLGDIINSTPWYIGAPGAAYPEALFPGYSAFLNKYVARKNVVYVGANDGMMHAFNANDGSELFSFIPASVYANLSKLTAIDYKIRTYVDGPIFGGDAYVGGAWASYLIGSTGRGAQSVFALDVTDPSKFNEANASDIFKWEFSDKDDADLGNVIGMPTTNTQTIQAQQIVQMSNGRWAAILGNGYGSENNSDSHGISDSHQGKGGAVLYILFLDGPTGANKSWVPGTDYIKIPLYPAGCVSSPATLTGDQCLGAGPNNGLGMAMPYDLNNDGKADVIYAADLKGNVWKINVKSQAPADWGSAYSRLYSASYDVTTPVAKTIHQPITTAVRVLEHPFGGVLVNFVTGKSLNKTDLANNDTQTMYGIWDKPANLRQGKAWPPSGRSSLQQQGATIVQNASKSARTSERAKVDWKTKDGWYFDLPFYKEKGINNPYYNDGDLLIFDTLFHDSDAAACGVNSNIVINMLDPITGAVPKLTFDLNNDFVFNESDKISVGSGLTATKVAASGVVIKGGISGSNILFGVKKPSSDQTKACKGEDCCTDDLKVNTSSGKPVDTGAYGCSNLGRVYWREVTRNTQ